MIATNQKVNTPIGSGVVQGQFMARADESVIVKALVRLPVNDVTRPQLGKAYCLTPRAMKTALFVFTESELK